MPDNPHHPEKVHKVVLGTSGSDGGSPTDDPNSTTSNGFDEVVEAIGIAHMSSLAEQPGMLSNLSYSNMVSATNLSMQNAAAQQQAMNEINTTVLAKNIGRVGDLQPLQSISSNMVLTGNAVAAAKMNLSSAKNLGNK